MRVHTVGKSIDCQAFEGFARQLHNFLSKNKKKTTIGQSINPRTVYLEEKDSGRNMRLERV